MSSRANGPVFGRIHTTSHLALATLRSQGHEHGLSGGAMAHCWLRVFIHSDLYDHHYKKITQQRWWQIASHSVIVANVPSFTKILISMDEDFLSFSKFFTKRFAATLFLVITIIDFNIMYSNKSMVSIVSVRLL